MPETVGKEIDEDPPQGFQPMPERLAYRYSGRSVLAEIKLDGIPLIFGSFHGTPGSGEVGGTKVGEWKPFFPGAVAIELAGLNTPFVFGIDANEPKSETVDSIDFHWAHDDSGARKTQALLGLKPMHRGRDLFREWLTDYGGEPASETVLQPTYAPKPDFQRRFDSIWATPEFDLVDFETHLEEAVAAGGDHAVLVADIEVASEGAPNARSGRKLG